jgi:teichuronic acid biosynthesis glycosyltransferase TuaC
MKFIYIIPGRENSNDFVFAKREYASLKALFPEDAFVYYLNTKTGFFGLLKSVWAVRKLVIEKNIKIVHAQYGTLTALFALFVSRGCKKVITFRGSDINGSSDNSALRNRLSLLFSWIAMNFSHRSIFVSATLKDASPPFYSYYDVIPSGVNTDIFFQMKQSICKTDLGLKSNTRYLLFYSSYGSLNKRMDLAQGALDYLIQKGHADIKLLVVDGGIPQEIMPKYINAVDAVLMLSDREGSPTIVQESLACGTPVVSVRVGDTPFMLENVSNSILVERNAESIANGILEVLLKGKITPAAEVTNKISLKKCAERIYCIYGELSSP